MNFGSILSRFTGKRAKTSDAEMRRFLEILTSPDGMTPPTANASKLLKLYKTSPWVRAITSKVASGVARQPWHLERPDGEKVSNHPALEFLRAGSPRLRGRQAMRLTQLHLDLAGEAFWALGRKGATPVQWAPIPPHWVIDLPRPGSDRYEIQPYNGQRFTLAAADVLAFRDADPFEPYERGTGIAEAAYTEVQTDEAAAEFLWSHFKNRARPDVVISGSDTKPLDEPSRDRLQTFWREKFLGPSKAGREFFSKHPLTIQEIGKSLRDGETSALREQQKAAITEIFGIPPEILGRLENSNRATVESADFLFGKHTLEPRLSFLADVIEPFLLAEFDIGNDALRFESPVPEDLSRRLEVMRSFPGKFTGNEVRALAGLRPRDEPEFDEPSEPVDVAAAEDDEPEPDDTPPKGKSLVTRTLAPEDVVRVSEAHSDPQVSVEVARIFEDVFGKLIMRYGSELLESLSVEVKFSSTVRLANWLADNVPELVGQIDSTTRKELAAALVEGAAKSEKLAELLARVDAVFADAAKTRAPLIGETMATKLTGFASQDAAEQAGFERKMWLTSQDQVVRDSHRSMNRQIVATKDKFRSPRGGAAMHPGAFGEAAEDLRCRCAMRPVLPGETTEESAGAADAFTSLHEREWQSIADRITGRARDVFSGQAEVIKTALRRAMVGKA
jgi:HK97 family phage portal protein